MCREKGLERTADHGGYRRGHATDVDGNIERTNFEQIERALRDVDRLVAHTFQVGVDLEDGDDEAQIDCHGLMHGEQVEREFVDATLERVNLLLAGKHLLAERSVASKIGAG